MRLMRMFGGATSADAATALTYLSSIHESNYSDFLFSRVIDKLAIQSHDYMDDCDVEVITGEHLGQRIPISTLDGIHAVT